MALRRFAAAAAGAVAAGSAVAYADDIKAGVGFDPEALERGAKALREINKSPYARKVFDITKEQEKTKQAEAAAQQAQHQAAAQQYAKEVERQRWEEHRKSQQEAAQTKAELARYEDELARQRSAAEHEKAKQRNAEMVSLQNENLRRQNEEKLRLQAQIEAERRATEQYRANLEKEVQREKALAEAEGRTRENRENEDVNRRKLLLQMDEERKKLVEAINVFFSNVGSGVTAVLTDRDKLIAGVGGLSLLALGVYSAREGTRTAAQLFSSWFSQPKLIRETSRRWFWQRRPGGGEKSLDAVQRDFSDIVLPGAVQGQVRTLAAMTANTKKHAAPFRHMLFFGPPGTGKTMAAKRMARTSGLDYAILSGGDVAPLGPQATTRIHETFDWAERSRRGLLLFIDEADAFLAQRSGSMGQDMRSALNALLFRTGDQSRDFSLVIATNRPGDLDAAVLDRMDESLEFALPGLAERQQIIALYMDQYLVQAGTAEGGAGSGSRRGLGERLKAMLQGRGASPDQIHIEGVTADMITDAARQTDGFSGRELAKLVASMQAAVYGSATAVLTPQLFREVLDRKVKEHAQRRAFLKGHHNLSPSGP